MQRFKLVPTLEYTGQDKILIFSKAGLYIGHGQISQAGADHYVMPLGVSPSSYILDIGDNYQLVHKSVRRGLVNKQELASWLSFDLDDLEIYIEENTPEVLFEIWKAFIKSQVKVVSPPPSVYDHLKAVDFFAPTKKTYIWELGKKGLSYNPQPKDEVAF